ARAADFHLHVTLPAAGSEARVTLSQPSGILASELAPGPDSLRSLSTDLEHLEAHVSKGFPAELAASLGKRMADILLPASIRGRLYGQPLQDRAVAARLWLELDDPEFAALPWELANLDDAPAGTNLNGFLTLQPHFHLIRRLSAVIARNPLRTDS